MKGILIITCGAMLTVASLHSEPQPKVAAHLRITDYLLMRDSCFEYNGMFSITNTGNVAVTLVTGGEWLCETVRFYQEATDEEWQRKEDALGRGKERKQNERTIVKDTYDWCLEKGNPHKTLQPGESVSFECPYIAFVLPFSTPGGVYKAEIYLGNDTWAPVHITPVLGNTRSISNSGDFFYIKESTNQYLHVKIGNNLKRVGEIRLGSRPEKEKDEEAVTFESPDGEKKKLTHDQARQIIREREQQNQ